MSDIVERLHKCAKMTSSPNIFTDAAAEIERLRSRSADTHSSSEAREAAERRVNGSKIETIGDALSLADDAALLARAYLSLLCQGKVG